jgi:uncharacterized protein YndB with AHSA1/START domain
MSIPNESSPVVVTQVIDATIAEAWTAWTDPDLLGLWFGPGSMCAEVLRLDVREGGEYRIRMRGEDDGSHTVAGRFMRVDVGRQLVMTWAWEGSEDDESKVSVSFAEQEGRTEIKITHTGLKDTQSRESHLAGWKGSIEKLATHVGTSRE